MSKKILRSSLVIILIVVVFSSFVYAKEIKTAEELYDEAEQFRTRFIISGDRRAEEVKEAIKKYKKVIKKYPKTIWAAKAFIKMADCGCSFSYYDDSDGGAIWSGTKCAYKDDEELRRKGLELFQKLGASGQFALAEYAYEQIVSGKPVYLIDNPYRLKVCFLPYGKNEPTKQYPNRPEKTWSEIITEYKKVINNYPNSEYIEESLYKISLIYDSYLQVRPAEGIEICQRLINEYPGSDYADDAQFFIARAYEKKRLYKESVGEYLKLVSNYPDSVHIPEAKKGIVSIIKASLSLSDLRDFIKERPKNEFVAEAEARISYLVQKEKEEAEARAKREKAEARAREEAERARAKKAKELPFELVTYAQKYREVRRKLWSLEYELKYKTPSYEIQEKAQQYKNFGENEYEPIARKFGSLVMEYGEIYGGIQLRDFAIEHGFLDLLN